MHGGGKLYILNTQYAYNKEKMVRICVAGKSLCSGEL